MKKDNPSKRDTDIDFENRILCSDGKCIGIIGPDGCCSECGKISESDQKEDGLSKMTFNDFRRLAIRALRSHIGFLTTPEIYEQIKIWAPDKEFTELMTHAWLREIADQGKVYNGPKIVKNHNKHSTWILR